MLLVIYYETHSELNWKTVAKSFLVSLSAIFVLGINYISMLFVSWLGIVESGKSAGLGNFREKVHEILQSILKLYKDADDYAPNNYNEVSYTSHETNERSLSIVPRSTLQYFTKRTFEPIEMPTEIYEKYFSGKDWEYFDAEKQIIIEGDTAYWCIF